MKKFKITILGHTVIRDGVRWHVETNSEKEKEVVWRYMWNEGFFEDVK